MTSDTRWVLMHELRGAPEPELPEQLAHLSPCDLVLVEGFKRQPIPKLEVWRAANDTSLLQPTDSTIVAIASDTKLDVAVPLFGLNQHAAIAQFILSPSWYAPYRGVRSNSGLIERFGQRYHRERATMVAGGGFRSAVPSITPVTTAFTLCPTCSEDTIAPLMPHAPTRFL